MSWRLTEGYKILSTMFWMGMTPTWPQREQFRMHSKICCSLTTTSWLWLWIRNRLYQYSYKTIICRQSTPWPARTIWAIGRSVASPEERSKTGWGASDTAPGEEQVNLLCEQGTSQGRKERGDLLLGIYYGSSAADVHIASYEATACIEGWNEHEIKTGWWWWWGLRAQSN